MALGKVAAEAVWDGQRAARAGVVLAQGPAQDNESSKIYYYLRTGLPVVCERPVPNAWLIEETGRSEGPGRPILYATTAEFLQHFGLGSLEQMPPLAPAHVPEETAPGPAPEDG